jgi:pimeloyl-[acyl-carrier protein] methyl ester esterase
MEPLVLVHGWAVDSRIWEGILPQLEEHFQVYLIDLPGYGKDRDYFDDYSLTKVAEEILNRAPAQPANWVAWSLGGTVALAAALTNPERFKKLQLISATPKFIASDNWPVGNEIHYFKKLAAEFESDQEKAMGKFLLLQVLSKGRSKVLNNVKLVRKLRTTFLDGEPPRPTTLQSGLKILAETDLRDQLSRITIPTQVIAGTTDKVVKASASRYLFENLANSHSMHEFEAGHLPFLQCPSEYIRASLSFFQSP